MSDCRLKQNITAQPCRKNYGKVIKWALDETNTGLTFADALLESKWIEKINAAEGERLYFIFPIAATDTTKTKAESTRVEGNTGEVYEAAKGKLEYAFKVDGLTVEAALKMKSFDGAIMYAYAITSEEFILSKKSATNIIPFPVTISVDEISDADESTGFSYITGKIYYKDRENYYEYATEPTEFQPSELKGINDVTLTVISSDVSSQTVIVDATGQSGESIVSLTTFGDWLVYLVAGAVARTVTAVSRVGNRYTLTVTDLTEAVHEVTLNNQPSMAIKGFECQTPKQFTPVA